MSFDDALNEHIKNIQQRKKSLEEEINRFRIIFVQRFGAGFPVSDPSYPAFVAINKRFIQISAEIRDLNTDNRDIEKKLDEIEKRMQGLSSDYNSNDYWKSFAKEAE